MKLTDEEIQEIEEIEEHLKADEPLPEKWWGSIAE